LGEGVTLKFPPAAWVSRFDQIPEEVGHLFAITHQVSTQRILKKRNLKISASQELWSMTLHECFGKFAHHLVLGLKDAWRARPKGRINSPIKIWEFAHREGYFLAAKLTKAYLDGEISTSELKKIFSLDWYAAKDPRGLNYLYSILNESPPTPDFKKRR